MQTLVSLFKDSVKRFSKKPFLSMRPRWRKVKWSFGEFENFASGIASILETHGVGYQDRVILIAHNCPMWGGAFFGTALKGAIVVPLNPQSGKGFVKRILDETKAKVVLKTSFLKIYDEVNVPVVDIDCLYGFEKTRKKFTEVEVAPEDIAEIVYTSGTTGDPKGVVLTHKNIMFDMHAIAQVFELSFSDRMTSVLPLFHMYEQMVGLFLPLKYGAEVMYSPSVSSRAITSTLQEIKATKMLVVPEILEAIVRKIESKAQELDKEKSLAKMFSIAEKLPYFFRRVLFRKVHKNLGGKLRMFTCGGAPLHEEIERKWNAMGFRVYQGYGLTETSPAATTNTPESSRFNSVGKPLPGVKVDVGEDGEILISGPNVFKGYYHNEAKTAEVFDEKGWFKTGDIGHFDDDGFLYISGRKKYMIVTPSGANVYPEDIETELKKIAGVKDAAVVGISENHSILIYAVLLGDIKNATAVVEEANSHLAPYQRIQDWAVWPEEDFPRSAIRKVKKEEVIKWINSQEEVAGVSKPVTEVSPLIKLVASVSGKDVSKIHENSNLVKDLHLDSLMRIELVSRLEESMDALVEEQQITSAITIKDLEKLIVQGRKETKEAKFKKWLLTWPAVWGRALIARLIVFPIYRLRLKVNVVGLENIKDLETPAIFMPNHISYLDGFIVLRGLPGRIRRKIAVAAALDFLYREYWWIVWFFEFLVNTYPLPRKEEDNIRPGLEYTGKVLDEGFSVMLFPEGKVSVEGTLTEFKKGAGLLATEMNVPIVPLYIKGIRDIMHHYSMWPNKRGVVTLYIGKPINLAPGESYIAATDKIYKEMQKLAENMRFPKES